MNDKIKKLKEQQRLLQTLAIGCIIILSGALLLMLKSPKYSIAIFLGLIVFYIAVMKPAVGRYRKQVKTFNIEECYRSEFKNITYAPTKGVEESTITDAHFLPIEHREKILIRDTIHGTYQAMPCFLTDVTYDYLSTQMGKNGIAKSTLNYISGCYFDIKLPDKVDLSCLIWSKDCTPESTAELYFSSLQEFTSPTTKPLEEKFLLYTKKDAAVPDLPESFIKSILRLDEYTPGDVSVQVWDNHLRVFIHNRFVYTQKVMVKAPITPQLLNYKQYPEINYILRIADAIISH